MLPYLNLYHSNKHLNLPGSPGVIHVTHLPLGVVKDADTHLAWQKGSRKNDH
jgi:hypothetical protein